MALAVQSGTCSSSWGSGYKHRAAAAAESASMTSSLYLHPRSQLIGTLNLLPTMNTRREQKKRKLCADKDPKDTVNSRTECCVGKTVTVAEVPQNRELVAVRTVHDPCLQGRCLEALSANEVWTSSRIFVFSRASSVLVGLHSTQCHNKQHDGSQGIEIG
jgi:hypothetical protein